MGRSSKDKPAQQSLDEKVVSLEGAAARREETSARVAVTKALRKAGCTQRALAKEIGVSAPTLSAWLQDKYKGDNKTVARKVLRWCEHREQATRVQSALPEAPTWVNTPTGERIVMALEWAQAAGDLVLAYGAAGVGKTVAATRYASTRPNVWLVTITPASRSVFGTLREVADAVGLKGMPGTSARLHREIVKHLIGTNGLLICDEAQHLSVQALEVLRAIHDATGVGLALTGNEIVYGRLTGGNRGVGFAQLFSRIGKRLKFSRPRADDVAALAEAWGIREPSAVAQLQDIAQRPGALRAVSKTVRLATMLALGGGSGRVTAAHLESAWKELGGAATWA